MPPRTDGLYVSRGPKEDRSILRFLEDGTVIVGATEDPLHEVLRWLVPYKHPEIWPAIVRLEANSIAFDQRWGEKPTDGCDYRGRWTEQERLDRCELNAGAGE